MHYIRLLRPPALVPAHGAQPDSLPALSLVLAITTDLGDSFLCPDQPLDLVVELHVEVEEEEDDEDDEDEDEEEDDADTESTDVAPKTLVLRLPATAVSTGKSGKTGKGKPAHDGLPAWTAGMRVLKLDAALPAEAAAVWHSDDVKRVCIRSADAGISATHAGQIVSPGQNGLVMPLWVDVPDDAVHSGEPFPHVALRRLALAPGEVGVAAEVAVEVEEEIGESIARHVWDAGLVTVAFLADACLGRAAPSAAANPKKRRHDSDHEDHKDHASLLSTMLRPLPKSDSQLRILELGSGVGILGIGLATVLHATTAATASGATVLLTDLPEAEERARSNMALAEMAFRRSLQKDARDVRLAYANLDWEDGRRGSFDAAVVAAPSDLVMLSDCTYNVDMLPALVETLGALQTAIGQPTQRVLLTKKTRHASEALLFTLLADGGWRMLAGGGHAIRLPVLDGDEQTIEVYLFERTV